MLRTPYHVHCTGTPAHLSGWGQNSLLGIASRIARLSLPGGANESGGIASGWVLRVGSMRADGGGRGRVIWVSAGVWVGGSGQGPGGGATHLSGFKARVRVMARIMMDSIREIFLVECNTAF